MSQVAHTVFHFNGKLIKALVINGVQYFDSEAIRGILDLPGEENVLATLDKVQFFCDVSHSPLAGDLLVAAAQQEVKAHDMGLMALTGKFSNTKRKTLQEH